jgi:geranylgeranyl diphosphate synthase type II
VDFDLQRAFYAGQVNARLNEILPAASEPPSELHQAMRYACLAPGKRLRPALCLGTAKLFSDNLEPALLAACALEMVHCFSLIHDDLPAIDNDNLRRGLPTLHVQYGEAIALLAGDALFALAFQTLAEVSASPDRVARAMAVLARSSGSAGLVGGEVIDVLSEGKQVDLQTLEAIHRGKTGSLIQASCQIAAILAGADAKQEHDVAEFGMHIGLAFQIADDILNEVSTAEQLGKSVGSDRERQKATYPNLFGVAGSRERAETQSAPRNASSKASAQKPTFCDPRVGIPSGDSTNPVDGLSTELFPCGARTKIEAG